MSSSGAVLGIDVGWSQKKKSSAVCHLSWSNVSVRWKAKTFAAGTEQRRSTILDVAGDRELLAVAIDGPIRPDLETVDKYRAAERVLSRGELLRRIGKPGQSSSPNGEKLNEQANLAARVLEESCRVIEATHAVPVHDKAIVEAFPTSFLGVTLDEPQKKKPYSDTFFKQASSSNLWDELLRQLLPGRTWEKSPCQITNHDERAALVCALTALGIALHRFTAVGDRVDGWIVLPPRPMYADWAWDALQTNLCREGSEVRRARLEQSG